MKYAKYIDLQNLDYAPRTITKNGIHYNPYPVDMMIADGYKPVVETAMPVREGYYYTTSWENQDTQIVRVWEEHVAPTPEPSIEDKLDAVDAQSMYTAMMTGTLLEE